MDHLYLRRIPDPRPNIDSIVEPMFQTKALKKLKSSTHEQKCLCHSHLFGDRFYDDTSIMAHGRCRQITLRGTSLIHTGIHTHVHVYLYLTRLRITSDTLADHLVGSFYPNCSVMSQVPKSGPNVFTVTCLFGRG